VILSSLMQTPAAGAGPSPLWQRLSASPVAWVIAGGLLLVGLFYLIRLLEWDLVNAAAENQEDPLLPPKS
jgi:hypothetical protein